MNVELVRATVKEAETLWKMQVEAFADLLEHYRDYDTNPANEQLSKTVFRLNQPETYFYFIKADAETVGAICIVDKGDGYSKRISPLFIMPSYRGKGIAQKAIMRAEKIHGENNWELTTILQEKGNCHLYEKMGYKQTEEIKVINERLTLAFYKKR